VCSVSESKHTHTHTTALEVHPQQREVKVLPGEAALAFYTAQNTRMSQSLVCQLTNVQPDAAANYFNKIQVAFQRHTHVHTSQFTSKHQQTQYTQHTHTKHSVSALRSNNSNRTSPWTCLVRFLECRITTTFKHSHCSVFLH